MRRRNLELAHRLAQGLASYRREVRSLPGIAEKRCSEALVEQLVESYRRIEYVRVVRQRQLSSCRADPTDRRFSPVKAAILAARNGDLDEAFWLAFLFVHFGRHYRLGWAYARAVYGAMGSGETWTWLRVSANPDRFRRWLGKNETGIRSLGPGFGNHRKYESLNASSCRGTGAAVESYVRWVDPPRSHSELFASAVCSANGEPRAAFDRLYRSMAKVRRFGRTARFDYLCMVSKLRLADIEPGSPYLTGATGPLGGARLLFTGERRGHVRPRLAEEWLVQLDDQLGVGMQALEDALCNWQKNPSRFVPFRA